MQQVLTDSSYLQTLLPSIACIISALVILLQVIRSIRQFKKYNAYTTIPQHHGNGKAHASASNGHTVPNQESVLEDDSLDEHDQSAQLALDPTISQAQNTFTVTAWPRHGTKRVFVEFVCVAGELVIHAIAARRFTNAESSQRAATAGSLVWTYITVLALARLFFTRSRRFSFPPLWYHTTYLYGCQWLLTVMIFRSHLIHPRLYPASVIVMTDFVLVTVLILVALTSRVGNRSVEVEYEGDIPPAKEPLASALSQASFSWVDSIVWTGYKKTFELPHVWNLPIEDKAANILADYRQLKKTSILAWHLLKYFKTGLLSQAAWSCFSGFLTFAPTLLLRAILEYIEQPHTVPRNSAWLFVILLFVSGATSALADNMALWIGRKVCIRLRAIIVGELYAKALRRRIGSSGEKVLGEANDTSATKDTILQKIKRLGRKKEKARNADGNNEDNKGESDSQVTSGAIINLMAVDSFKVADISAYLHFLWANTPVQAIVAVALLYQVLGFSSIAGIGMMVVLLPINLYISKQFAAIQTKILAATDARINNTNEVLTNIRIIKYFAWEQRFMNQVSEKRTTELQNLRIRYLLWSAAATIWGGAPILITFLSFAVYTLVEKRNLIPSVAFTALSLFQLLRIPLDQLADMVAHVQESKVSVDRIEEFLNEEDTQKYKQLRKRPTDETAPCIGFDHSTLTWGGKKELDINPDASFRMIDLDLRFVIGQLNVIVGPTGCGKTSLLLALLGEMTLLSGRVHLPGGQSREDMMRDTRIGLTESVAFCAQQAWLVNDTIKENIVFASAWDPQRYKDVIKACALQKDFEILDHGDETLVGEKGVTLSGGQKQRISLARALYCNARHVLLDDVLSAVDSHSQKWIFERALLGPLMANRTCILVTHSVSLCVPRSDFTVVLDNGRVSASGTLEEIKTAGVLSEELSGSNTTSSAPSRAHSSQALDKEVDDDEQRSRSYSSSQPGAHDNEGTNVNKYLNPNKMGDKHDNPTAGPAKAVATPSKIALDESKAEGRVSLRIILMYFKSMGGWMFWVIAATAFIAYQLSNVSTNVWIRQWANAYASREYSSGSSTTLSSRATHVQAPNTWIFSSKTGSRMWNWPLSFAAYSEAAYTTSADSVDDRYYLGMYAILGIIYMIITFTREFVLFLGSLHASKLIHDSLIEKVCRAKFRFFDSTPLGQIMNRFSKDIENIDQEIAPTAVGVIHCLVSIVTIVILISVITPGFLIAGTFISVLYFLIGHFYINSSRDLRRIESVQRSPIYQQFGETLSGMVTIRAYGDERRFIRDNLQKINTHNRPFIYFWATNRWLAFRVDIAGALVSFFAGAFVVLSVGKIDPGAAGLAMTYAVTFTENVLWFVRLYASNEQNMNSVERIKEYLDVDQEAPPIVDEKRPPPDWPADGAIEFKDYTTRYRVDFDTVLRGINLSIKGGEKIGIVGRTGAGKSSMALSLFRALEAEKGSITVDGVQIGEIGLQDLRERIVMVPQDPTLFSGTVRSNLDPFELYTDEEIFNALRRVQLVSASDVISSRPVSRAKPAIMSTSATVPSNSNASRPTTAVSQRENRNPFTSLNYSISESGSNLSQGQRQLLCLARALLKDPKVLLMDEATASIDYNTDAKIQETIRELKGKTMITIAHRLKTIVDYDRVVVLERGQLVECGIPWELLRPETEVKNEEVQGVENDASGTAEVISGVETKNKPQTLASDEAKPAIAGKSQKRWFRQMCEMSGELEVLEREAKRSFEERQKNGSL